MYRPNWVVINDPGKNPIIEAPREIPGRGVEERLAPFAETAELVEIVLADLAEAPYLSVAHVAQGFSLNRRTSFFLPCTRVFEIVLEILEGLAADLFQSALMAGDLVDRREIAWNVGPLRG